MITNSVNENKFYDTSLSLLIFLILLSIYPICLSTWRLRQEVCGLYCLSELHENKDIYTMECVTEACYEVFFFFQEAELSFAWNGLGQFCLEAGLWTH